VGFRQPLLTIEDRVRSALLGDPHVTSVELIGSRAEGTAGEFSDWDFAVEVDDFDAVAAGLPARLAGLDPLAAQWDRLSEYWTYMLILHGPVKIDLLFLSEPHELEPPWIPGPETLGPIDDHFWDWLIWLRSKQARGKSELVAAELDKLWRHLLGPLGAAEPPASLDAALSSYLDGRSAAERRLGVEVSRRLEREVVKTWRGPS
jgi:predicted nucleotidyltransferase